MKMARNLVENFVSSQLSYLNLPYRTGILPPSSWQVSVHNMSMEDPINPDLQANNRNDLMTADDDDDIDPGERAAAIAEVSVLPAVEPTSAARRGTGGGTRGNEAADEAIQTGDMHTIDVAGAEVQSMFMEFLFGL